MGLVMLVLAIRNSLKEGNEAEKEEKEDEDKDKGELNDEK
jgi:hypothetical protein